MEIDSKCIHKPSCETSHTNRSLTIKDRYFIHKTVTKKQRMTHVREWLVENKTEWEALLDLIKPYVY